MIKVFEMFAGYGGASFSLKKTNMKHEVVGYSEINKYAIQCYEQNHKGKNFGDCTNINPNNIPDFDLLTAGFPCQAFSVAGKMQGELDPRGTLFYEIIRIAKIKKPKYILLENVKGLTTKKFKDTFNKILNELDQIGYHVHWKVLNTKDFGIPQNRERVYFVCIRKDLEQSFMFPEKEELQLFLKDILENEVDEKYILSDKMTQGIIFSNYRERKPQNKNIVDTLKIGGDKKCILIKNATKQGYIEANIGDGINLERINSLTRRGRVQQKMSSTLQCNNYIGTIMKDLKIRRLTPKEYFKLQGFLNDEINLEGLSDTQKYKLAGNGWDINLVSKILKQLIHEEKVQ